MVAGLIVVLTGGGIAAFVLTRAEEAAPEAPPTASPPRSPSPSPTPTTAERGAVPPELRGTYSAEIEEDVFDDPSTAELLAGRWTITIKARTLAYELPNGAGATERVERLGEYFAVRSEPAPKGIWICYESGARSYTEGNATYDFIIVGEALGLAAAVRFEATDEPCPRREAILERDWIVSGG